MSRFRSLSFAVLTSAVLIWSGGIYFRTTEGSPQYPARSQRPHFATSESEGVQVSSILPKGLAAPLKAEVASRHRQLPPSAAPFSVASESAPLGISTALDLQQDIPLPVRLNVLRTLDHALTRGEWEALRGFLLGDKQGNYNESTLLYIQNEVMAAMSRSETWRMEFADCLKTLCSDHTRGLGLRDYALQFIAVAAEQDPMIGWDFHFGMLKGAEKTLASAAALHLLGAAQRQELKPFETATLGKHALRLAEDASIGVHRATALNVCAALKISAARRLALRLGQSEAEPYVVRIAAIAALGRLGGDERAHAFLETLARTDNSPLRVSAQAALSNYQIIRG